MGQKKSKAAGKSSETAKGKSTAVTPKDARPRRRANMKIVQNVLLIWLDANIDEDNDADCRNAITQLQRVVNNVNTFTNDDQCIEFIDTIDSNNHKVCMIISGSLGQHIMSRVHKMSQVDSIFIFFSDKKNHEQWVKDWSKIKGVFTEITPICEALKVAAQQCEHNAIPISFMATGGDDTNQKKLDQLDCSFMYTQIIKDTLLTITFEKKHFQEFIEHCRDQFADIEHELKTVKQLEREYHTKTPVWWYTCESFLYPMLNTALRSMDVDVMIKMGFFITDLHRQIKELHAEQFGGHNSSATSRVYRGQGMSKNDFEQMTKTKGGLIAFNSFLSTSKLHPISLNFARRALSNPDLVGILFVMTVDPSQSTTPFASINEVGYFEDQEDEVLFSMHSVFRIRDIKSMGENNRLYQVDLTLTNDNDKDLHALTDRMEEEMEGSTGWHRLGRLLLTMKQSEKAEQVYKILLQQTTDKIERATYYHRLGWAKDNQGEYKEALALYEKSLAIRQQSLPPNHPDLAKSYNNIGLVYFNMGDYSKALSYYEKALAIDQQSLPPNHPDLATSYMNIGNVYYSMGDYSKALSSHEEALAIRQQSLPPNHPDLASSYNNIGNVYSSMGDHSKALSSHEKSLALNNNHFLRIILIWLLPTGTSVWCIRTWVTIRKHIRLSKKHLQFNNNHFLRIILIWLLLTWESVWCMTIWVTIRKHFRLTKNPLQLNNDHFLRIILIWLLPTTTSVMCISTWVTIRKHFRITKRTLKSLNNYFLRIILIWLLPTTTSAWSTKTCVTIRKHVRFINVL
jgi:tetratricopeptide (TPR) repeat protein